MIGSQQGTFIWLTLHDNWQSFKAYSSQTKWCHGTALTARSSVSAEIGVSCNIWLDRSGVSAPAIFCFKFPFCKRGGDSRTRATTGHLSYYDCLCLELQVQLTLYSRNKGSELPRCVLAGSSKSQLSAATYSQCHLKTVECLSVQPVCLAATHTVKNCRAASSSLSSLIRLRVGRTLLQGPHHSE